MKTRTETLVAAMRLLARDIHSDDGVANAAIAEAAERLSELEAENAKLELTLKGAVQRGGELLGENAKLREALRFYAKKGNWERSGVHGQISFIEIDQGAIAHETLEE